MKNKVFITIAFIASIVAGVAICLKKGIIDFGENNKKDQGNDVVDEPIDKPIMTYTDLNQKKDDVSANISERHEAAGDIIREMTSNIFKDSSVDHKLDFDEIDSGLDDLLDEE